MKRESRDVWAACKRLILQTKSRSWDTHKDLESLSEVNDWGEDPASLQVLCLELIGLYVRNFVSDSSSKSESYLHFWFVLIRDCSRSFKVAYGLPRSCLTVGRRIGWIRSRGGPGNHRTFAAGDPRVSRKPRRDSHGRLDRKFALRRQDVQQNRFERFGIFERILIAWMTVNWTANWLGL